MYIKINKFFYLSLFIIIACNSIIKDENKNEPNYFSGNYIEEQIPDTIPKLFGENFISTPYHEQNAAFSPDGKEFYFTIADAHQNFNVILVSKLKNNQWTHPEIASFSGKWSDFDPFISPDGQKMFFISRRPIQISDSLNKDADIWYMSKTENAWDEPKNIGEMINSEYDEYYVSVSKNRNLYFSSTRPGGYGQWNIYYSKFENGLYSKAVILDETINSPVRNWDPYIASDESFIIFTSLGFKGYGGSDLYISYKDSTGKWGTSINLGNEINSEEWEYCPNFSFDGKYFFFSKFGGSIKHFSSQNHQNYTDLQNLFGKIENGLGNIYWVNSEIIPIK
ncbi:MAG: PD40 domain-containing protein [Bacteroidales bacterium]|nr:PD40 domain-containing protein [Bacteroidales bacterium]